MRRFRLEWHGGLKDEIRETEVEIVESVDEGSLPEFVLMIDVPD